MIPWSPAYSAIAAGHAVSLFDTRGVTGPAHALGEGKRLPGVARSPFRPEGYYQYRPFWICHTAILDKDPDLVLAWMIAYQRGLEGIPMAILWFGAARGAGVLITAYAAFFPIVTNTLGGVSRVRASLIVAARTLGAGEWTLFRRVVLPGSAPLLLVGLRLGIGLAWAAVIAAELATGKATNAPPGIGYLMYLNFAAEADTNAIVAMMAAIGLRAGRRLGDAADRAPPRVLAGRALSPRMHRYVHYAGYPPQLFDLAADPEETRDLGTDPAHAAARAACEAELRGICAPEAVDRRARADQRRRLDAAGGAAAVLAAGVKIPYTPAPAAFEPAPVAAREPARPSEPR